MNVLALELSSGRGSIACTNPEGAPFFAGFANDRKHSGLFFENLALCLEQGRKADRIVVGLGPGSYAGIRIAIATAVGLQAATDAELLGGPSFRAMETDAPDYCVIGDARRQTFYFSRVRERRCIEGPDLFTREELRERLGGIDRPVFATESLPAFPEAEVAYPSALVLAGQSDGLTRGALEPIYLRAPHITQPKTRQSFSARA